MRRGIEPIKMLKMQCFLLGWWYGFWAWVSIEHHIWKSSVEFRRREKKTLNECGCVCYCPNCLDILNDQAEMIDDTLNMKVYYKCNECDEESIWTFDAAPAPILLSHQHTTSLED